MQKKLFIKKKKTIENVLKRLLKCRLGCACDAGF